MGALEGGPWLLYPSLLDLILQGQVDMAPGFLPLFPGKAMRKGTGFVLRSKGMMSFRQSGKCLGKGPAIYLLII